jgi:protein-tyrosine phosphatase
MGPGAARLMPPGRLDRFALWGVHDGPPTRSATVAIARAAVEAGTRTVVGDISRRLGLAGERGDTAQRLGNVNEALREEGVALEILAGAEVALTRAVELDDTELRALCLGNGPWLLLEPPMLPASAGPYVMF